MSENTDDSAPLDEAAPPTEEEASPQAGEEVATEAQEVGEEEQESDGEDTEEANASSEMDEDDAPDAEVAVGEEEAAVVEDPEAADDNGEDSTDAPEDEEEDAEEVFPLEEVVEAMLFAAVEPVTVDKLAKSAGRGIKREAVREVIINLNNFYEQSGRAFEVVEVAEKISLMSKSAFAPHIQRLYGKKLAKEEKEKKLSPAALDTLSIIAYKQPATRAEIEEVRGVGCGQLVRQLMERGLVKPVGKRMSVIGYPTLYGTTVEFLQEFGLAKLDELPMIHELRRHTGTEDPLPEENAEEQQTLPLANEEDDTTDQDEDGDEVAQDVDDEGVDDGDVDDEDVDDEDVDDEDVDDEDVDDEDVDDEDVDDEDVDDEDVDDEDVDEDSGVDKVED